MFSLFPGKEGVLLAAKLSVKLSFFLHLGFLKVEVIVLPTFWYVQD